MTEGISSKYFGPSKTWVENYVAAQAISAMDYKGGYDASTNTPDLDTSPSGVMKGDFYTVTVAGIFFTVSVEAGDAIIAEKNDPTVEADWTIVNKNINEDEFQRILSEGAFVDGDKTKLDGIESEATADQTNAEILAAFESETGRDVSADGTKIDNITVTQAVNIDTMVSDISSLKQSVLAYGIRWNDSTDVITKGVVIGGIFVETDYTEYPIQDAHSRVLFDPVNLEEHRLNADDSTYLEDGATAATFDGSMGDVCTKSPKYYELWTRDGNNVYVLISFSQFSFNGYTATVPQHFQGDYYYYHCFEGVLYDDTVSGIITGDGVSSADTVNDKIRSLPGYKPWTYQTRADFRTLYRNVGGNTHQQSWSSYQSLVALFVTKYGTWDSQTALPGYTEASAYSYGYVRTTGRTLTLGNTDGSILVDLAGTDSDLSGIVAADKYIANSFLGIENPFGHLWKFIDGFNLDNTTGLCKVYTSVDFQNFADDTTSGYVDTGFAPAFGDSDGYIKNIYGEGTYAPLYPKTLGGSSATYFYDYHYNSQGVWRVMSSGGALSTGLVAGLCSFRCAYSSAGRHPNFAARGGVS